MNIFKGFDKWYFKNKYGVIYTNEEKILSYIFMSIVIILAILSFIANIEGKVLAVFQLITVALLYLMFNTLIVDKAQKRRINELIGNTEINKIKTNIRREKKKARPKKIATIKIKIATELLTKIL